MKLDRVELRNIRQFVGQQSVVFSTDSDKKVTLLHGPNTSGKTTLLNAVYWCFYGRFLEGFKEPERLKSEESEEPEYSVEVRFEHRGKRYIARRAGTSGPGEGRLSVLEIRGNGQSVPHPQPELLIGSILPEVLAPYFFFAGEMIQKGLASGAYQQTATQAIRAVLGLKLAEQAIQDLKEIKKKKQKELQTLSAGTDLARITQELDEAESFVESRQAQLTDQRALASQLEAQQRELSQKLRGFESSATLQQRRDKTREQLRLATAALNNAFAARQELVADYGPSLYLSAAAKQALSLLDDAVTKKRIPSPFDKAFVQDVLSSRLCVCGRPIEPGSSEYRAVATLINSATDETSIRRAMSVRGVGERISSNTANAQRAFNRVHQQYESARAQVERLEQEDARITDLLSRHEDLNVRGMEAEIERVELTLRELVANKQRTESEIAAKQGVIEALRRDRDRATAASPQVERARTSVDVLDALIQRLEKELVEVEKRGLRRISDALNEVVANSTRQRYSAKVTPEYSIELSKDDDSFGKRPVRVLSSGEQRLIDLCFVSALVAVCREREIEQDAILLPGAVAPMIVDAPFGELDPEYQALAARTMMELSDQLVLLLSKTHRTPEVDNAIRPCVGKEYLLVGYRADAQRDAAAVEIEIENRRYPLMFYDAGKNRTEIQPIGEGR